MAASQFDPHVQASGEELFRGEFLSVDIRDLPSLPHEVPNRVLELQKEFFIEVAWKVSGVEVPLRMSAVNHWSVFVYGESVGPGPELALMQAPIQVPVGPMKPETMSWSETLALKFPIEQFDENDSGVYKLCIVIFAESSLPGAGNDIIGYTEIPTVLFHDVPQEAIDIRGAEWKYELRAQSTSYDSGTLKFKGAPNSGTYTYTNHYGWSYSGEYKLIGTKLTMIRISDEAEEKWVGNIATNNYIEGVSWIMGEASGSKWHAKR